MKKVLFIILCSGFLSTAMAKDSTWKLCVGDVQLFEETVKLVVNVFEHRNGAESRQIDLTMIYGGNILSGNFDNTSTNQASVILKNDASYYRGLTSVDFEKDLLTLRGRISLHGSVSPLAATIRCATLAN